MINNVRNTVLATASKDNRGYITPAEFNLWAKMAQIDIVTQLPYDYSNALNKQNSRLHNTGYSDIPKKIAETLEMFRNTHTCVYSAPNFSLPTDALKMEEVIYNDSVQIDRVSKGHLLMLNQSLDTAPSVIFPVYIKQESGIKVYPATITSNVTVDYIRLPRDPKWTYSTLSGGEPVFNQGALDYQDFELPGEYESQLAVKILQYAGISIGESELVQAAKSEEIQDKQERL
jgi:hypothetical protein